MWELNFVKVSHDGYAFVSVFYEFYLNPFRD